MKMLLIKRIFIFARLLIMNIDEKLKKQLKNEMYEKLQQQLSNQKSDEEVNSMIIYL